MLLNLFELYKETVHHNKAEGQLTFKMREVVINRQFITFMREETSMQNHLSEGRLPETLPKTQKFTRISIAQGNIGQDVIVVGDLHYINDMFNGSIGKTTLKG